MSGVKADLRAARVEGTEARIVAAAHELFLDAGYTRTTLAAVATRAGLAPRTVYVRFGTKAALLKRVIDVAVAGDTRPVPVSERDWYQKALSARTLAERIEAYAAGATALLARAAGIMNVAREAEATDDVIAAAIQAGREATRDNVNRFWVQAHDDGLLGAGVDLAWLANTTGVLAHGETYLLIRATLRWSTDDYRDWIRTTWTRLANTT